MLDYDPEDESTWPKWVQEECNGCVNILWTCDDGRQQRCLNCNPTNPVTRNAQCMRCGMRYNYEEAAAISNGFRWYCDSCSWNQDPYKQ